MKKVLSVLGTLSVVGACGYQEGEHNVPYEPKPTTPEQKQIEDLKVQILMLQGTVSQINAFVANDFSSCGGTLPAFEQKVCQIAQTATAEQRVDIMGRLGEATKVFQEELYGVDCWFDYVDQTFNSGSCPAAGSVLDRLTDVEATATSITTIQSDITTLQGQVATLQTDVTQLQTDLSAIETRLDNFDGSGDSIETVISGLDTELASLDSRLDTVETTLSSAQLWNAVAICDDVTPDTGPNYETLLVQGDGAQVVAYTQAANGKRGLGVVWSPGDGDLYLDTALNTLKCNFALYEIAGQVSVCWVNNDRNANSVTIDTQCDRANDLATPTANCTCK